jgi:hypothetical protein
MTQRMDPEAKAAWVEALRSKEYKQGRRQLVRICPDGSAEFCCMGVLCDVAGLPIATDLDKETRYEFVDEARLGVLPLSFAQSIGLGSVNPGIVYDGLNSDLAELNDRYRLSFSQIADLIEAQL